MNKKHTYIQIETRFTGDFFVVEGSVTEIFTFDWFIQLELCLVYLYF